MTTEWDWMAEAFPHGLRLMFVRQVSPERVIEAFGANPAAARWLTAGLAIPVIYLAGVTAVGTALARGVPATVRIRIPVVLAAMHMAWGAGFLTSPRGLHRKSDTGVGQPDAATENAAAAGAE